MSLSINQPLPTDRRLYLRSGSYNIEDYDKKRQTIRLNTRLGIEQPIEAFYAYNKLKTGFLQAELNYELSKKQLLRSELDIKYEVAQKYYNLISWVEHENIAKQTMTIQQDAYELAQSKYEAGLIAEVEALQMEVDLGKAINNYDINRVNSMTQANAFKQLIGLNLKDSIIVHWQMEYQPVYIDPEKAVRLGLKHRLEICEKEIDIELAKINIKKEKLDGQITGSVSAYYDLIGVGEDNLNIGMSNTYQDAINHLKSKQGDKGISFNISIPVWDWGVTKSNLRMSQHSLNNEKITVEREIREVGSRLNNSLKRLQLLEKNVKVAEKIFEISKQRFSKGEINSQSLALDRNRLSQAYIDYKLLLADLTRKTFYDFEKKLLICE